MESKAQRYRVDSRALATPQTAQNRDVASAMACPELPELLFVFGWVGELLRPLRGILQLLPHLFLGLSRLFQFLLLQHRGSRRGAGGFDAAGGQRQQQRNVENRFHALSFCRSRFARSKERLECQIVLGTADGQYLNDVVEFRLLNEGGTPLR